MAELKKYPTKPLETWQKAKELRQDYYRRYADPNSLRWSGSTWAIDTLTAGLGDDVANLTGEPYGASIAFNKPFAARCVEAAEAKGWARDLCSYFRNYFGGMYLNEYVFGGPFPKPAFCFTSHICCTHAKWYQYVSEYEGAPFFAIDVGLGAYKDLSESRLDYLSNQMLDAIEWMEKVTGRKYDDEKFIEACKDEFRSTSTWAKICELNKTVPAPLDEKSMHSLYVFGTLNKHRKDFADLYDMLLAEVQDRIANGIAATPYERCRVITDTQPPWGFLHMYRYLEKYGAVSVGNLYVFGLVGIWEDQPDGSWGPAKTPMEKGIEIKSREQAVRLLAEWNLRKPQWQHFSNPELKIDMMKRIFDEWKLSGIMLHYNRGCEGLSLHLAQVRLGLMEAGIPVMGYEGNMGDEREFDEVRAFANIDTFMESMSFNKIVE